MSNHPSHGQVESRGDLTKLSVRQFAERFRGDMIPLSSTISYYCASLPMTEEDVKEYLDEPVAALPPSIKDALPKISILFVPYLEREQKKTQAAPADLVSMERPPENRLSTASQVRIGNETVFAFGLKDQEVAEYHYRLYNLISNVAADPWPEELEASYVKLLREELAAEAHGEVDEASWRLKQGLRRGSYKSSSGAGARTFRAYAKQSFIDTLTLYLHGICCDIDVDTGPRQLPSRFLRKRLVLLSEAYPPPQGYTVFPEQ